MRKVHPLLISHTESVCQIGSDGQVSDNASIQGLALCL